MVNDVHSGFYSSLHRWISSIAGISFFILCFSSQNCIAMDECKFQGVVENIIDCISDNDSDRLLEKFDNLEETIQSLTAPLKESRQFLQTFIEGINKKFGLQITINEACILIRRNLHTLNLPKEMELMILETADLFESDSKSVLEQTKKRESMAIFLRSLKKDDLTSCDSEGIKSSQPLASDEFVKIAELISGSNDQSSHIHLPRPKNKNLKKRYGGLSYMTPDYFFSLNRGNVGSRGSVGSFTPQEVDTELPGSVCAGGAEILAGALTCVLGFIFPPAYAVGGALIMDGFSRVLTGLDEMDQRPFPGS